MKILMTNITGQRQDFQIKLACEYLFSLKLVFELLLLVSFVVN